MEIFPNEYARKRYRKCLRDTFMRNYLIRLSCTRQNQKQSMIREKYFLMKSKRFLNVVFDPFYLNSWLNINEILVFFYLPRLVEMIKVVRNYIKYFVKVIVLDRKK